MEPVPEDRLSPDPDVWSGSNTPAELDDLQDEDYYGETDSEVDPKELNDVAQDQQDDLDQDRQDDLDQDQPDDLDPDPNGSPLSSPHRQHSLSDYSADGPSPEMHRYEDSEPGSGPDARERSGLSPVYSPASDADPHYANPSPSQDDLSDHDSPGQPQHDSPRSGSSFSGQAVTRPDPGPHRGDTSSPEEEVGGRESPEEQEGEGGGRSQAPPACVSFGIPVQGAEAAEDWGSEGESDLYRASRNGARDARLRRGQSQSEKQQKEAKSKCKRIASLLTNAPNPTNKGVLMFKKRRQRAKKFTLVSYGTGEADFENEGDSAEYEDFRYYDKDGQSIRITLSTPSDPEFEEEYYINAQSSDADLNYNYNWGIRQANTPETFGWEKMDKLPQTKGKGVLMFAQRRQRMDEIAAEHEEMRRRGIPVEGVGNAEPETPKPYAVEEDYTSPDYMDTSAYQHHEQLQEPQYQQQQQQQQYQRPEYPYSPNGMNGLDALQFGSGPKALVANRTAKPFLSGQSRAPATFSPVRGVPSPTQKKPDNIFKVPVPVNMAPHVWSPTGDIIASRDERIAVPAIRTGILPETRRRGTNKSSNDPLKDGMNAQLQTKGDRRSFIESGPEEDFLSLGAEACNFMQAPRVKHKTPPPVAPKPTINPACPPWSSGTSAEMPLQAPRSPVPASSLGPAGKHSMIPGPSYPQAQPNWAPNQELQPAGNTWGLSPSPTQAYPQAPINHWAPASPQQQRSWMPQPQQDPVSMPSVGPAQAGACQPKAPWTKPQTDINSIASCPPISRGTSYSHAPKAPPASSKGHISEISTGPPSDGPNLKGKGAELFARRQSRMEKFVVDAETVQANVAKSPSPTPSLPSTWKYSPNVRAPPPTSYNPILSPSYPPGAIKQPPSTSPKVKPKAKQAKPKAPPKHLNALDVMKHKPYQLDTSLFMYNSAPEVHEPSPKSSPVPPKSSPVPPKSSPAPPKSSPAPPAPAQVPTHDSPTKANPPVLGRSRSLSLPRRSMSSVSPQSPVSPYANPGRSPTRTPLERHASWVEKPAKPLTPWEAAAKSPLGLVDEAFAFQDFMQVPAAAAHRRSLPEPPLEWKQRVSNEPVGPSPLSPLSPLPQARPVASPSRAAPVSPSKPTFYGPPFRPAQPLTTNTRYQGTGSLQRKSRHSNSLPPLRISRVI